MSQTSTCGSCRHWGRPDDYSELVPDPPFRTCYKIINDKDRFTSYGIDEEAAEYGEPLEGEVIEFRSNHFAVVANSPYAELNTRGDFGCRLFEGRETP